MEYFEQDLAETGKDYPFASGATILIENVRVFTLLMLQCLCFFMMLIRLLNELEDEYCDTLIITQCIFSMLLTLVQLLSLLTSIALQRMYYSVDYLINFNPNYFGFIIINQLYWFNLIIHVKYYKQMRMGAVYDEVRQKIRRIQIWEVIFLAGIYLLLCLVIAFMFYSEFVQQCKRFRVQDEHGFCYVQSIIQRVMYYINLFINGILIFTKTVIYCKLMSSLKNNLHRYYVQNKKKLKLLFLSSIIYIALDFVIILASFIYFSRVKKENLYKGVFTYIFCSVHCLISIVEQLAFLFYIFYSIYNIKFKEYLFMLMYGYHIHSSISKACLFLTPNPFYKPKESSSLLLPESNGPPTELSDQSQPPRRAHALSEGRLLRWNFMR
ncbi:unnamed protein product [Moneuplotes crassus]|uniref:Uncharacterized protein n=1 Tax=Euplotes crassus TaxID=5936 RepID=A0AAD1XHI8_EUPCR|nr:unnamed protein product [Moneuplotes crassus]